MKKIVGLFTLVALCISVFAFAAPQKAKKAPKLTEVWTCPITGKKVTDKASKTAVAGKYKVHFCCNNCPAAFAKLSAKDKAAKAAEAAKKDKASAQKPNEGEVAQASETKAAKLTDVWTCPITGGAIKDHSAANASAVTVGKFRVHFCCDGCPSQFEKLSAEEKLAKAEEASKKKAGS